MNRNPCMVWQTPLLAFVGVKLELNSEEIEIPVWACIWGAHLTDAGYRQSGGYCSFDGTYCSSSRTKLGLLTIIN